jgi:signal transduction histidine kinase
MRAAPEATAQGSSRAGLRSELVVQLGLLMTLAVIVLVATLSWAHERALAQVVGRALAAEARAADSIGARVDPGTDWWIVQPDGSAAARGPVSAPLDARTRDLAQRAREADGAVVDGGAPWEPIRFAMGIDAAGRVAVARVPADFSRAFRALPLVVVAGLVCSTLGLFLGVGFLLLRTRVVDPLERLARAARELAESDGAVLVPVDGPAEAAHLANAFNEMSVALAERSKSLASAVADLRSANQELRRTQEGLARAERLAVVGRLAAGVAHEVGNPLGAILALTELVARDPGISEASRAHLAKAGSAGERVRRILGQLLDYSRPARPARAPFDLAAVARECRDLVCAQRTYQGISLDVEIEPNLPRALGDAGSAAQIVLNLALNAADACLPSEAPRVVIRVFAGPLRVRASETPRDVPRARLDAVVCAVLDNGTGVASADRARVFDPFFTTKAPGRGTGLGLATAQRLAQEMEGELELSASAPEGFATEFTLRLPAEGAAPSPPSARGADA